MAATLTGLSPTGPQFETSPTVQPLENGDVLGAAEFLRRYQAMPHVKKAELIEGVVYMPSPVRLEQHAAPDTLIQTWLGYYAARTPGTQAAGNATLRLDVDNVPQPDALLRLLAACGRRTQLDAEGYLSGPPELIVEIAASSVSIDLHDKLRAYRRAGVPEYLVWRTLDHQLDWFVLDRDEYRALKADSQGLVQSAGFPGLTLALEAVLRFDSAQVLDALETSLKSPAHQAFVQQLKAKSNQPK